MEGECGADWRVTVMVRCVCVGVTPAEPAPSIPPWIGHSLLARLEWCLSL
jgi:hypothetical protein